MTTSLASILRAGLAAVVVLILFAALGPFRFTHASPGLDPSWVAALGYSVQKGFSFGSEITFPGGPLNGVYTRYFVEEAWLLHVILVVVIGLANALPLARLASGGGLLAVFLAIVILTIAPLKSDTLMFAPAFMMVLVKIGNGNRLDRGLTALVMLAGATGILAKFSALPIVVFAALSLDVVSLSRRQWPLASVLLALFLMLLLAAANQNPMDVVTFLHSGIELSSSYAAAMSIPGRVIELTVWLSLATALFGIISAGLWDVLRQKRVTAIEFVVSILAFALFLFLNFKAGFVRHDLHSLIAWAGLAVAALAWTCLERTWFSFTSRTLAAVAIASAAVVVPNALIQRRLFPDLVAQPREKMEAIHSQTVQFVGIFSSPGIWLRDQIARQSQARTAIRTATDYPRIDGPIDMIPSNQSDLIAHGFEYRPRPTIQEYATFSPALIARNRLFFEGERAPQHILMRPGSIDYRHPASAEGSLWPLFLSAYEPVARIGEMVQLTRRRSPLAELIGPESGVVARFRERIPLPPGNAPILLKARIERKLIGRLLDIAFKPPIVTMNATYPDGRVVPYRIIPGMISEGMVISPLVETAADYLTLAAGRMDAPNWRRPVSISFDSGLLGAAAYGREIVIKFAPLLTEKLLKASAGNAFVEDETRRIDLLAPLLAGNPLKPPHLDLVTEGLLAHAPMSLKLPVTPGSRLRIAFGIRDGAWQGDAATDGVCFSVNSSTGVSIYQRCLQPRSVAGDRGVQEAEIQVPPDVNALSLETTCMAHCAWDWSYWSAVIKASE